jgi:peptidyl-prolyl cis-trans isomerase A (cyclophilin A)
MIRWLLFALLSLTVVAAGCGERAPDKGSPISNAMADAQREAVAAPQPVPDRARVRLTTAEGDIDLELDGRRAPVTTANFLAYVDQHRFDGITFYRAARTPGMSGRGFIQGGIRRDYRRMLNPIRHEPTSETGLRHVNGTISMARTTPGSAMGDFFIILGDMPAMDSGGHSESGDNEGYAAFGRVVGGLDVVRRILAAPTVPNAGRGAMRGQMLVDQVTITSARRLP